MSNFLSSAGGILDRLERGAAALGSLPFDVISDVPRILRKDPNDPARAAQRFARAASDVVSLPFEMAGKAAGRLGLTTPSTASPSSTAPAHPWGQGAGDLLGLFGHVVDIAGAAGWKPAIAAGAVMRGLSSLGRPAPTNSTPAPLPGVTVYRQPMDTVLGAAEGLKDDINGITHWGQNTANALIRSAPAVQEQAAEAAGQVADSAGQAISNGIGQLRAAAESGVHQAQQAVQTAADTVMQRFSPPVAPPPPARPAQPVPVARPAPGPQPASLGYRPNANEGALLERISIGEGTSDDKARAHKFASGYDVPLAYGALGLPSKPLSQMTLDELDQYQTAMLRNPANRMHSSASGKYQITRTTLRAMKKELGLRGDEVFSPELQDRLAMHLLKGRGYNRFRAGKMTEQQFQEQLSKEWASVARPGTGKSYYGQATGTQTSDILPFIHRLR